MGLHILQQVIVERMNNDKPDFAERDMPVTFNDLTFLKKGL